MAVGRPATGMRRAHVHGTTKTKENTRGLCMMRHGRPSETCLPVDSAHQYKYISLSRKLSYDQYRHKQSKNFNCEIVENEHKSKTKLFQVENTFAW